MFPIQGNQPDETLYVDDVFSTYLYTGNGSTQTITNGIDLAGKGGLVWIKDRDSGAKGHALFDTARGVDVRLQTQSTNGNVTMSTYMTSFNSNGFGLDSASDTNGSPTTYTSWTFRKAPKFFDVVTYTGNGVAGRTIAHSLGVAPGMIVVKATSVAGQDWMVYHRSLTTNGYLLLNSTGAASTYPYVYDATDIDFKVASSAATNGNGTTYVAYLFAHDTTTDGIIQCGSFTTDGGGNATVNLGWEPQWLVEKGSNVADPWWVVDTMRGWEAAPSAATKYLTLNSSDAESTWGTAYEPTATGFKISQLTANKTFIYLAIRRPNKPPTSGTSVYNGITANNAQGTINTTNFPIDLQFAKATGTVIGTYAADRLRGVSTTSTTGGSHLITSSTAAESSTNATQFWDNNGFQTSSGWAGTAMVYWNFRRAPGVFDVVCYTGTGVARTVNHNLGAVPELIIVKGRSYLDDWYVYAQSLGTNYVLYLDGNNAKFGPTSAFFNNTAPTSSSFTVATSGTNQNGATYVAYLFASLPGISKVGSYTGNGSSQTINCGFTTGARFVLIKRTDSTGDWFVWDSTRGIVAGNDPHLSLNTTAAEVTTDDSIDPDNSGFIVNQLAATNINVTSATYIYLAFA